MNTRKRKKIVIDLYPEDVFMIWSICICVIISIIFVPEWTSIMDGTLPTEDVVSQILMSIFLGALLGVFIGLIPDDSGDPY